MLSNWSEKAAGMLQAHFSMLLTRNNYTSLVFPGKSKDQTFPSYRHNKQALKILWCHCDYFIIDIPVVQGYFSTPRLILT